MSDLDILIDAAERAGDIATEYAQKGVRRWDKPGGAGPVTEADLAVNDMLEDRLRAARPDYGWLSEESEDQSQRQDCAAVFIIDPIDGTRSFADGSRTWAHSLAIAVNGSVTAAVVYLPMRDLLYAAAVNQGATLNGTVLSVGTRTGIEGAQVLTNRGSLEPRHWIGTPPQIDRIHRPSLAYRMALVAQGRFDAMLTVFPAWEWDIAAGDLILREAGAIVSDTTGATLRFNNAHPRVSGVVAGPAALHNAMVSRLRGP